MDRQVQLDHQVLKVNMDNMARQVQPDRKVLKGLKVPQGLTDFLARQVQLDHQVLKELKVQPATPVLQVLLVPQALPVHQDRLDLLAPLARPDPVAQLVKVARLDLLDLLDLQVHLAALIRAGVCGLICGVPTQARLTYTTTAIGTGSLTIIVLMIKAILDM